MLCLPDLKSATLPEPRLATHIRVAVLIRLCGEAGGFAAIVKKGDATAGTLLVLAREKGRFFGLFEQFPRLESGRKWEAVGPQVVDNENEIGEYLARRHSRDPDLWVVELDIASEQRLAELLAAIG